jgi:hypothetical protein
MSPALWHPDRAWRDCTWVHSQRQYTVMGSIEQYFLQNVAILKSMRLNTRKSPSEEKFYAE